MRVGRLLSVVILASGLGCQAGVILRPGTSSASPDSGGGGPARVDSGGGPPPALVDANRPPPADAPFGQIDASVSHGLDASNPHGHPDASIPHGQPDASIPHGQPDALIPHGQPDAYVPPGYPDAAGGDVSFSNDLQPIFRNYGCISCHGSSFLAYSNLVNVQSQEGCGLLVQPGSPSSSYLYEKCAKTYPCSGQQMPEGSSPLSAADLKTLSDWISEGAPNN